MIRLLPAIVVLLCCLWPPMARAGMVDEWRFRVLLDGREIGHHRFTLNRRGGELELESEADFEVRLLFATLYRYRHVAAETWQGNCLSSVTASTDANGKSSQVRGSRAGDVFEVVTAQGVQELPACVMSFAYWNPDFLRQQRLLNPQDGEFLDVRVSGPVTEPLAVAGLSVPAQKYRLVSADMDIALWYSGQGDWLALESRTEGGRLLRYERQWATEPAL